MAPMDNRESSDPQGQPAVGMAETRVCPGCGSPAGAEVFCSTCGLNLSNVVRLPTQDQWKRSTAARGHAEAQRVAAALATIQTLTPFRYPRQQQDGVFRYDGNTTADTVRAAVQSAITRAMPREDRDNVVAVTVGDSAGSPETVSAVATITLSDGALLRQQFEASTSQGSARIRVSRAGQPSLILPGLTEPVDVTTDAPAKPHSGNDAQPNLSSADARELAARRARDAELEARLHGWKPLPIWYAFWSVLLGILAIVVLVHGQVLAFLGCAALSGVAAWYVRYLYNGGRRRVWFIFW